MEIAYSFIYPRLGKESVSDLIDQCYITTWLLDRRALTIACIVIDDHTPENQEINAMIKQYDEITDFCWPAEWTTVVCACLFPSAGAAAYL